LEVTTAELKA